MPGPATPTNPASPASAASAASPPSPATPGRPASPPPTTLPIPTELLGRRVLLRPYEAGDAAALKEAVEESRATLGPWMPWSEAHQTLEESIDWCVRAKANFLLRQPLNYGLWDRQSGRYLGGTGYPRLDWKARAFEIGYWLRTSAVGHGYMTEAVRVLTRAAFEELGANRTEIRCDARNDRSRQVAERCGYVQEGRLRRNGLSPDGELRDTLLFGLVREEYEALLPGWSAAFP